MNNILQRRCYEVDDIDAEAVMLAQRAGRATKKLTKEQFTEYMLREARGAYGYMHNLGLKLLNRKGVFTQQVSRDFPLKALLESRETFLVSGRRLTAYGEIGHSIAVRDGYVLDPMEDRPLGIDEIDRFPFKIDFIYRVLRPGEPIEVSSGEETVITMT